MHIVIGLVVGTALGILAGSAAVQYLAPAPTITMPASKLPTEGALPRPRSWDI